MVNSKSKKKYELEDEILVKIDTVMSVKVRDLDIHPEYMSINKIKKLIADHIDSLLRESDCIEPVTHSLKLLKNSTKSKRVKTEEDSI